MLTGDKTLTAESIAKSTGLSQKENIILRFTKDMLEKQIREIQAKDSGKTENDPDLGRPTHEQEVLGFNVILHKAVTLQMTLLGSEDDRLTYSK